jgi:hypothetical protein
MSLNKLSRFIFDWIEWNVFEIKVDIKVDIIWRIHAKMHSTYYIKVPIVSDDI